MTKTVYLAAAMLAIGIAASILTGYELYYSPDQKSETIRSKMIFELFKFSITTVLFGSIVFLYKSHSDDRKKSSEMKAARRERIELFLKEFSETYNEIKFLRRELRHNIYSDPSYLEMIDIDKYNEIMKSINICQLKLELFRRILESKPQYLDTMPDDFVLCISRSENYLRGLTWEYEYRRLTTNKDQTKYVIDKHSKVFSFVKSRKQQIKAGEAHIEFFYPLDHAFEIIYKSIRF